MTVAILNMLAIKSNIETAISNYSFNFCYSLKYSSKWFITKFGKIVSRFYVFLHALHEMNDS